MKKLLIVLFLFLSFLLTGCIKEGIKDDQVYLVEKEANDNKQEGIIGFISTEGRLPFQEYEGYDAQEDDELGRILITISPDGQEMYFMEYIQEKEDYPQVIKGEVQERVRLIKINKITKEQSIIVEDVPFISLVRWNYDGTFVAFAGGGKLTIYDTEKDGLILENELKDEEIMHFFWSPRDDNKIYTEKANLANGSIYYVDSHKKVEAYETKEQIYFKGKLDNDYYYGTKWYVKDERINKEVMEKDSIYTVIIDKQGNIVKVLGQGRFRDSYKKAVLLVGEGCYGLNYIADINVPENFKTLTKEYVYDVKFVADGKIAFIVENKDIERNSFWLYILDKSGKEIEKLEVSGDKISLLPNGEIGYIGGPHGEKINFKSNRLEKLKPEESSLDTTEEEIKKIFTALRGALDTLYKYELTGVSNYSDAEKFFIDTHEPEQWAYFDVVEKFKEGFLKINTGGNYRLKVLLEDITLHNNKEGALNWASVKIMVEANNNSGGSIMMEHALELIKRENKWFVTGFSTFPNSELREKLLLDIEKYIKDAQEGLIFEGELKDKELEIGQIQFWSSGMPHLSPAVESADICKVYIKVKNEENSIIYKLILENKNQNYWKATKLSKEEISYL